MRVACKGEGAHEDIQEILQRYGSTLRSNSQIKTDENELESRFLEKRGNNPNNKLDFGAVQSPEHPFQEITASNIEKKEAHQADNKCSNTRVQVQPTIDDKPLLTTMQQGTNDVTTISMVEGWEREALYRCGEYSGHVQKNTMNTDDCHSQLRLCSLEGRRVVYDELNFHGIHSQITVTLAENWSTLQTVHDRSLERLGGKVLKNCRSKTF